MVNSLNDEGHQVSPICPARVVTTPLCPARVVTTPLSPHGDSAGASNLEAVRSVRPWESLRGATMATHDPGQTLLHYRYPLPTDVDNNLFWISRSTFDSCEHPQKIAIDGIKKVISVGSPGSLLRVCAGGGEVWQHVLVYQVRKGYGTLVLGVAS